MPDTAHIQGKLLQPVAAGGQPIVIDGLWSIGFGSGAPNSGTLTTLFFAAVPGGESHGLFGSLTAVTADLIRETATEHNL